ncbi:MAG: hypothetical protein JW795_20450, partial [Chitinivibrionales bacterium]|nr:hypothetical protein [Chitinivibrionales bacterium]
MSVRKSFFLISIFLILHTPNIIFSSPFSVATDRSDALTLRFSIPSHRVVSEIVQEGKFHSAIYLEGATPSLLEGYPDLPLLSTSVAIAPGATVSYEVVNTTYSEIDVDGILPSKGSLLRSVDPSTVPYTYADIYRKDCWFPEEMVQIGEPYLLREIQGVPVRVTPFQYNPALKKLRIYSSIDILIKESAGSPMNVRSANATYSNNSFRAIYENTFVNFTVDQTSYAPVEDGDKMVVIVPEKFKSSPSVKEYIDWKNQAGIETKMYVFPTETGGSSSDNLKSFITKKYNEEKVMYVVIFGEFEDVTSIKKSDSYGSGPADQMLAMVNGTDKYPDLFIGRFSASAEAGISVGVKKAINYEKNPDANGDWYGMAAGSASSEGTPTDISWMDQMKSTLTSAGYSFKTLYHQSGSTNPDIQGTLSAGLGLFLHMGHGSPDGFGFNKPSSYYFKTSQIPSLSNGNKLPIFFAVAC